MDRHAQLCLERVEPALPVHRIAYSRIGSGPELLDPAVVCVLADQLPVDAQFSKFSQVVQRLLEQCTSIKVKRLFLWSAERIGHAWSDQLEPKRVDLGSGKRQLYKGGVFDRKYQITVPQPEELPDV